MLIIFLQDTSICFFEFLLSPLQISMVSSSLQWRFILLLPIVYSFNKEWSIFIFFLLRSTVFCIWVEFLNNHKFIRKLKIIILSSLTLTVNLTQPEKAVSVEGPLRSQWPMRMSVLLVWIVNWCWWGQATESNTNPWAGSPGLHMNLPKCEQASQPASHNPPWFLLEFLAWLCPVADFNLSHEMNLFFP